VNFKAVAREILPGVGHPLHYLDMTEITLESGYLNSVGRTPQNTMRARLSMGVRDTRAPFVQTAPGVYGLKGAL
jgi:hypothetical protein